MRGAAGVAGPWDMGGKGWKAAAALAVLAALLLRCSIQDRRYRLPHVLEPALEAALHEPMDRAAQALALLPEGPDFARELQRLYGMRIQVTKKYSKARLCTPYQGLKMAVDRYRAYRGCGEGYQSRQIMAPLDSREQAYMRYGGEDDSIRVSFGGECKPLRISFYYCDYVYVGIELSGAGGAP